MQPAVAHPGSSRAGFLVHVLLFMFDQIFHDPATSIEGGKHAQFLALKDRPSIAETVFLLTRENITLVSISLGQNKTETQGAMEIYVQGCNLPHVCERTFFDPVPRSQYMLTHQLLSRQLAAMSNCLPDKPRFVNESIDRRLCAKMYQEAQLLGGLLPKLKLSLFGDLLSEHIALCGFSGFPNFFRADWLNTLLDMQSRSEYGCFMHEPIENIITSSKQVPRELTKNEISQGKSSSEEVCLPHFTSVALSALTMYADYIEDKCNM